MTSQTNSLNNTALGTFKCDAFDAVLSSTTLSLGTGSAGCLIGDASHACSFGFTVNIGGTSNQLSFNQIGNTIKINVPNPAATRTYTVGDLGGNGNFLLTSNTTTTVKTSTYVPTIGDGTHNFTTGTHDGYVSVIGDTTAFTASLVWSSKGSASGNILISLPSTLMSDSTNYRGIFTIQYMSGVSWTSGSWLAAGAVGGASSVGITQGANTGSAPTSLTDANFSSSGSIIIGGVYRTA